MSNKPVFIFDFFGVLCEEVGDIWIEKHDLKAMKGVISKITYRGDIGEISMLDECELLGRLSGQSAEEVLEEFKNTAKINTGLVDYIKNNKDKYRFAMLSNASSDFVRSLIAGTELEQLFEKIYISSDVQMVKPDAEIFHLVCETMQVLPRQCILIDDREQNVDSAKAEGMKGILYSFPRG